MAIDAALGRLGIQTGVCTSSTRPANPYEGQVIYETDTNRSLVYDSSAWVVIANASSTGFPTSLDINTVDSIAALQAKVGADSSAVTSSHDYKIADHATSIADHASRLTTLESAPASGLVFLQNITTPAAIMNIDNCFSSAYTSYRLVMSWVHPVGGQTFYMNFRSGGVSDTSAVHDYNYVFQSGSTVSSGSAANQTNMVFGRAGRFVMNILSMDIHNPYTVSPTSTFALNFADNSTNVPQQWIISAGNKSSTSYDGISINLGGYTPTYMKLSLYGYRDS